MAESVIESIRQCINAIASLNEAKPKAPAITDSDFQVVIGSLFPDSLQAHLAAFPNLREKLSDFIDVKQANPLTGRYGKHDRPFDSGTPLVGYGHCHLRDDAILIYTLSNRKINLIYICRHDELDTSKRATKLAKKLSNLH